MGVLTVSFIACGNKSSSTSENTTTEDKKTNKKILITYFGLEENADYSEDTDATTSASLVVGEDDKTYGTTQYVAKLIQEEMGGDIKPILTKEKYPEEYEDVTDQNHQEQGAGIKPELKDLPSNLNDYDIIYIGYPVWATTLPRAVVTYLEKYDWKGKTVIPFCIHAGYGSGDTYDVIKGLCRGAGAKKGVDLEADQAVTSKDKITQWLSDN